MKTQAGIATILLLLCTSAYSDDITSVEEGASKYDWNICFDNKMDACKFACSSSEDFSCIEDCEDMASHKCESEGLQPPEY